MTRAILESSLPSFGFCCIVVMMRVVGAVVHRRVFRIGRCLINLEWMHKCQNSTQYVLNHNISDHYPLILKHVHEYWGPKPFRILNS